MRKLFDEARQYGRVNVYTMETGGYHCSIKFNTISHCSLEACSSYGHTDPEAAIKEALAKAKEIVASVSKMGTPECKSISKQ